MIVRKFVMNGGVDKLDRSISFTRQKIDCSFEEILGHLQEESHFVVIDRGVLGSFNNKEHFEVGFRSVESIDYFLFIEIESDKIPPMFEKYGLVPYSDIKAD